MKEQLMKSLPTGILKAVKHLSPSRTEYIDSIILDSFIGKTQLKDLDVADWPASPISQGEWEYRLFNMCFVEDMLRKATSCLEGKCRPVINVPSPRGDNLWEWLFVQPFNDVASTENRQVICSGGMPPIYFPVFPTFEDVQKYGKLHRFFMKPNAEFESYFETEYESLIAGKRVLGVLCRGTDYVTTKPKGHPIQPFVSDVISLAELEMNELGCEAIYLATEEHKILEQFESAFPGKVITNKREYFDSYYGIHSEDSNSRVSAVHFDRDDDDYLKSIEYFSSLFLLSRCTALVAGCCGGSRAALYLNGGCYEYSHLFNLGVY